MISSVLATVYQQLTAFAGLESFWVKFEAIFGTEYNIAVARSLRSQWQSGNFSQLPTFAVISDEVLGNARGAYASSTNVIYLAASLVEVASPQVLEAVILEEIGHFVDAQVNTKDTAGDEGELFSAIARGISVSAAELSRIKTEDDHAVVMIDGQATAIEMAFGSTGYIQFGTSSNDWSDGGIRVDSSGSIYVVGRTTGVFSGNSSLGGQDAFISKYSASGVSIWTRQLGSSASDYSNGIDTDSNANSYVVGWTSGSLPSYINLGGYDGFISKYDANGTQLWIKQFGSSSNDYPSAISTDSNGNSYIAGQTFGRLVNTSGDADVFISKYDTNGNQLWIKQFGSSNNDSANGISIDSNGNSYIAGWTFGQLPGNSGSFGGNEDAFISKYDANGNQLWVRQFGSSGNDFISAIKTNNAGSIYAVGDTNSSFAGNTNFGGNDIFITKYDTNGNQLWVRQLGSSGDESSVISLGGISLIPGNNITTDNIGNVYITGSTNGNLPGSSNIGGYDVFVAKYDANGNQIWIKQFGTSSNDEAVVV